MIPYLFGDSRLIWRWRSDREKTAAELTARSDIPDKKKTALIGLFGKLELRYTRWRCYSTLDGSTQTAWYRVVAKDAESAVVVSYGNFGKSIYHVHFDDEYYWIILGRSNIREYFRRVP